MFKTIPTIGFICVICLFLAPIVAKATIAIDPAHKSRILIGPDPTYDWVEVRCVERVAHNQQIVKDFCDNSDIQKLEYQDDLPDEWLIYKKHSLWVFIPGANEEQSILRLERVF